MKDFDVKTADWREQLRQNEKKTKIVIATFLMLYILVGLLVDTFIGMQMHRQVPPFNVFMALITFELTPYATLVMLVIAGLSLLMTYTVYDKIMLMGTDSRQITPENAASLEEKQLLNVIEEMKVAAGLHYMPKVYIIEADYMNAFASGYSEKSAMVAITRGLMQKLDRAELQAVMAHELSHIRHHDIKLTLTVSVLSNIMLMVIDMLFYAVLFSRDRRRGDQRFLIVVMLLRYLLPLITALLTLFLSRTREYMADAGAVELMRDNEPMARALLKISGDHKENSKEYAEDYGRTGHEEIRHASYIYDPSKLSAMNNLSDFFSTHPSTSKRLAALGFTKKS